MFYERLDYICKKRHSCYRSSKRIVRAENMAEENENACKRLQSRFSTAIRQWQRMICRLLQNLTADYSRNLSESN